MNYTSYTKMNSQQLAEEIAKNKDKIKRINDTISVLKKLKIAEDFLEREQNKKTENEQSLKPESLKTETPKTTVEQSVKQQPQQTTSQQQQPKQKQSGGVFNGFGNKIRA